MKKFIFGRQILNLLPCFLHPQVSMSHRGNSKKKNKKQWKSKRAIVFLNTFASKAKKKKKKRKPNKLNLWRRIILKKPCEVDFWGKFSESCTDWNNFSKSDFFSNFKREKKFFPIFNWFFHGQIDFQRFFFFRNAPLFLWIFKSHRLVFEKQLWIKATETRSENFVFKRFVLILKKRHKEDKKEKETKPERRRKRKGRAKLE